MWVRQFPDCHTALLFTPGTPPATQGDIVAIPPGGASTYVAVLVESPFTCPWTVVPPSVPWVTITTGPVSPEIRLGDGNIYFFVPPNPTTSPRSTVLLIGERALTVTQLGQ